MKENVGRRDRILRIVVGSSLLAIGYGLMNRNRAAGATALAWGAMVTETAITRVCPINALLGIDTRRWDAERESIRPAA
jgi:hypothetical protein